MGFKENIKKIFEKDSYLEKYLEQEFNVKIVKKYGAFIIVFAGQILDYFYTLEEAKTFLESKPDYKEHMISNGCPAERFEVQEEATEEVEEELTQEEAEQLLEGKSIETRRTEEEIEVKQEEKVEE